MMDCMKNTIRSSYKNLGKAWCPKFGEHVAFTADGLRHLVRKRGILRSKREQRRRFALLAHAKDIIQDATATVLPGNNTTDAVQFWVISKQVSDKKVSVVVRQFKGKAKHFFSIYAEKAKKQKPAPESGSLPYPPSAI